jgi:DegV family protein with EDD domain
MLPEKEVIVKKVAIMTDTISQMPQEIADRYDIKLMPLNVIIEGKTYLDTEVNLAWFYQQMPKWKEAKKIPMTSSISIGVFFETYRELSQKAEAILYISHSVKLGMSPNAALQAKKMAEDELLRTAIEVVDSGTACGAQMLVALEAAKAAAAGKSLPEVIEVANNIIRKVKYILLSDDLYYLVKGGRIHKARPWAGSKITNTALLELDASTGGEHIPLARCKTKGQTLEALFDVVKQRSGGKGLHVAINHADALAEAEELKQKTLSQFQCVELYISPILPVVTTNVMGGRAFSWWSED